MFYKKAVLKNFAIFTGNHVIPHMQQKVIKKLYHDAAPIKL